VSDRFYLNPEYSNFESAQTRLRFNHFFRDHVPLKFLIPVFLVWLPLSAYLLVHTFDLFSTEWAYKSQGVPTKAQVANCEGLGENDKGKQILRISYTYNVQGIDYRRENGTVQSGKPCEQIPQELNIVYLFTNPAQSRLYATSFSKLHINQNGDTLMLCALAMLAVIVMEQEIVRNLNARRDLRRLRTQGKMLTGEIIHSVLNRKDVEITYRFVSPQRDMVRRTQVRRRTDLGEDDLPQRGTLVNVLYVNDDLHLML
jgi:hypothetical protein